MKERGFTERNNLEGRTTASSSVQPLKSLAFALSVLEAFGDGQRQRGVTELAQELGASKATIYRVLATFEQRRYVVQDPATRRYRLGPRLFRVAQMAAQTDLVTEARPVIEGLRDVTGETVAVAVLDGAEALYVAKAESPRPVRVVATIGDRVPAYCTSYGKVLLAYADPDVVDEVISGGLVRHTDLTLTDPEALNQELGRIRDQGYAINRGEFRAEVRGVAAPVFDDLSRVAASVNICGPSSRLSDERLAESVPHVVEAAARLSIRLGAPNVEPPASLAEVG